MSKVEEIEATIETLSGEDYSALREWFVQRDSEKWDEQIEADAASGKLDFLLQELEEEKSQGTIREL